MSYCLMIRLDYNKTLLNPFFLQEEDIIEKEDIPHCTVIYGLDDSINPEELINKLSGNLPDEIYIKNLSLFENDEDVLKLDVILDHNLIKLRNIVKQFPNKESYPIYQPHVTIAYLKKGSGEKYLGNKKKKNIITKLKVKDFHLSRKGEEKELDFNAYFI